LSYQSKQKRRRKRIAVRKAKREHAEVMRHRYYLTVVKRDCACVACGRKLRGKRDEMVYSKAGAHGASSSSSPVTLCVPCADKDPLITYGTSLRWEQWRRKQGHGHGAARGVAIHSASVRRAS
jgi:hypothetical protein